jgi:hypothetical protein
MTGTAPAKRTVEKKFEQSQKHDDSWRTYLKIEILIVFDGTGSYLPETGSGSL